jgi:FkbM family methyltransferase
MKYSIVIPTYNHCDDLLKPCISSLFQYSHMRDIELIISANGCTDNTLTYLQSLQQQFSSLGMEDHLKIVWHSNALGFSRAVNEGIKVSTQNLIVLLSNDVQLLPQPKNNWLERLDQPFSSNPKCGITCSTKMYSEHAGREFAIFFCVMIHKKVFDKIGLLNEEYGVGSGEDIEFSIETELAGFEVIQVSENRQDHNLKMWISDFPIYHQGEGTVHDTSLVPNWPEIFQANMQKVAQKYNPQFQQQLQPSSVEFVDHALLHCSQILRQHWPSLYHEIFEFNCYSVQPGDLANKVVVDIGAHVGLFSLFATAHGASLVLAVEANPNTYQNWLLPHAGQLSNVRCINRAVTAANDQLVHITDDDVNSTIAHAPNSTLPLTLTNSLKTLLQQEKILDNNMILKLDVEGSEFDILLNTDPSLLQRFSTIFMEVHNNKNPDPRYKNKEVIQHLLTESGFQKTFEIPLLWFGNDGSVSETGVWNQKWIRNPV